MRHDTHFLSRLERLDREHAEIALGLYYDSGLVKHILKVAKIASNSDTVALCLGTEEDGPFVIVARNGHFVTCLGEGMRLQEGQPVVSRHRLDTISENVESLRSLVADASAGGRRQTRRKLERLVTAGGGLGQEEFDDLARWLPLLSVDFLKAHMAAVERAHLIFDHLSKYNKLKRRHDELLHGYWQITWEIAHLTMLLGSDGGARIRSLFEFFEQEFPESSIQLPWCLIRLGVASFAARGAWVASKMPTLVVPVAKRRYLADEVSFLSSLTDSLSLSAVGLRHRRYHAEVGKVLARAAAPLEPGTSSHIDVVHSLAAAYYDCHSEAPSLHLDRTIDIGRKLLRAIYGHLSDAETESLALLPSAIPAAALLALPHSLHEDTVGLQSAFEHLPWLVSVEARDFYLPEPFSAFLRHPWTRADGLVLYEARRAGGVARAQPVIAAPKIGRNAPCPCASGQKYKRCCGAPGQSSEGPSAE